jgi:cell division septation protein DedD
MDKYLQEILLAHLSVILPEFGALSLNEDTKTVVFNPFVTYNDEKFENFLVEKHNIEKQAAANMVAQYVKEIQNHVNKGESFIIFKFGRFIKSKDDTVEFQNWAEFNKELPKEKKTTEAKVEEIKVETIIEKVVEPEIIADKSEKVVEEKKKNTYVSSNEKEAKIETKAPEVEKATPIQTEIPKKEAQKKEIPKKAEKPVKPPKPPKVPKEKKERKKRSAFFYVNIALLLLLITGGVLIGLNYSKVQTFLGFTPKKIEQPAPVNDVEENMDVEPEVTPEENNADSTKMDEQNVTPPTIEKAPVKETTPAKKVVKTNSYASSSGSFHIIGGGFADPANAERFVTILQEKGLSAQVIGVFDGLSLVSMQSFSSRQEAQDALNNVASQSGIKNPWIFNH